MIREFKPFREEFKQLHNVADGADKVFAEHVFEPKDPATNKSINSSNKAEQEEDWLKTWERQQEEKADRFSELLKKARDNEGKV